MTIWATARYAAGKVSPNQRKWFIRWVKFRIYLRFPGLLFKRFKWVVEDIGPVDFVGDTVLRIKAEG